MTDDFKLGYAAAIKDAADARNNSTTVSEIVGKPYSDLAAYERGYINAHVAFRQSIRALTPPDAEAALRRAVEQRILPLVWYDRGASKTPFGTYYVGDGRDFNKPTWFYCGFEGEDETWHKTKSAAKSAAQTDYPRRILAAMGWETGE